MSKVYTTDVTGQTIEVEIGKLAEQANGACTVKCGGTVVFVSATASKHPREGIDFFPLTIDFEEKMYAVGRLPGGFIKREGRPTEKAILTARLIDRPLRPLFPKGFRNDVHVVAMALSIDPDYPPEVFAMLGSSIALSISDIPFAGPTGAVSVGLVDGEYIINPTSEQREKSRLQLTVAGTKDAVMMVEAGASELSEDEMLEAIMQGHDRIRKLVEFQEQIVAEIGKEKVEFTLFQPDAELEADVSAYANDKILKAIQSDNKMEREDAMDGVTDDVMGHFKEKYPEREKEIDAVMYNTKKKIVRGRILNEGMRPDGRGMTEIRPLSSEVGLLPRVHGSGLFKRGQTQVLTACTLAPMSDMQMLDGLWDEESKRYIHHYNFPPYSVGETGRMRGPGRREIGHGALAERALLPVIPPEEDFPYTLRLVSEVMSSNGSTSQASVCGSTLALMDAGVPIISPVAGVAMGLIKDEESGKVAILTDIQGMEDFLGDMDFKVAGTEKGITAIQMDIKIKGIDRAILKQALAQALDGRLFILKSMLDVIPEPHKEMSAYAPKIINITIDPDKIREVIGPGGKVINGIIDHTGVKIDIEDDGRVFIYGTDVAAADKALKMVEDIVKEVEVGEVYEGKVMRILDFGAFVEILPGKEGLVHISKLAWERVGKVQDVLNIGDTVTVKVVEIDDQNRINLSRKALLPKPEGYVEPERPPRRPGNRSGGNYHRNGGGNRNNNNNHNR